MPPKPKAMRAAVRDARAKAAKAHVNITIPALLKANPRAKAGVLAAERISSPPSASSSSSVPPTIKVLVTDTLTAASLLSSEPSVPSRIAILNMASPLRPGGGLLTGATSQEEFLCARTTLYPSLSETHYRLPDLGGIYTPDVLVARDASTRAEMLPARDRFYVDVLSAAMLRLPDVDESDGETTYAEDKDREAVRNKMRAVMRILRSKGVDRVVLGAWGCGAYGNPVGEVARAWKTVLCGGGRAARKAGRASGGSEGWEGLQVVFAISDVRMARVFAETLGVEMDEDGEDEEEDENVESESETEESDEYP